jgi:hypothetical protein
MAIAMSRKSSAQPVLAELSELIATFTDFSLDTAETAEHNEAFVDRA